MTLYSGIKLNTAITQGIIKRLNFPFTNSHPVLVSKDGGAKYPETKNMVDMTITSKTIPTMPTQEMVSGSSTIQNQPHIPAPSYTPPTW
jgi:hypothetical protein